MNQFLFNLLKVYGIASLVYIAYLIYLKISHQETLEDKIKKLNDNDNENLLLDEYKKNKRIRIMVFIIGVVIGLAVLIMNEPESMKEINNKIIVTDVSDISVI
jgi:threonine/homoserine/homoserine lactone efflux protein